MTEQLTLSPTRPAPAGSAPARRMSKRTRELGLRRVAEARALLRRHEDESVAPAMEVGVRQQDRHAA